MRVKTYPLNHYVAMLHNRHPFTFVRYGDGEWLAMLGAEGRNCDGHPYYPQLGADLRAAVKAQRGYMYAIGPKATHLEGNPVERWLADRGIDILWHSTEVWLEASLQGKLAPLVKELRRSDLLYVGPGHLAKLMRRAAAARYYEVPAKDCYSHVDRIVAELDTELELDPPRVVGFSAGMTTNVIIDRLYPKWGSRISMIDFGSVFDVYAGVKSRKYMRNPIDWQTLGRLNGLLPVEGVRV